jgi:hypothetical protein
VERLFAAPRAGWQFARYQSPDVMIAAESPEAIRRGDYQLVIGELHVAMNTLSSVCRLAQHHAPEELTRAAELDLPEPRVVLVNPKNLPMVDLRTRQSLVTQKDYLLMSAHASFGAPQEQALTIGALVVEDSGSGVCARTRDRSRRFDLIEVFADLLTSLSFNQFQILQDKAHTPRINFDRTVIARETWSFRAVDAPFAFIKDAPERFVAARSWARSRGMPRFVFAKTPIERKPFYVDFDSPIYVELLAKVVRQTHEQSDEGALIALSEMMPRHDQVWLPDAEGQRYTSEFRIVAVDQSH